MAKFVETKTISVSCPVCDSAQVVRHGKQQGEQRYRCRACAKVFTDNRPRTFDAHGRCRMAALLDTWR